MSPENSDPHSARQPDQHGVQTPTASSGTNAQPTRNNADDRKKLSMWKDAQWWQVWVNAILIPAGVAALIIYANQLNQMKKATRAATEASASAKEMSHLDQRAWVGLANITGTPTADSPFKVTITAKNSGRTFAKKFTMIVYTQDIPEGTTPQFSADEQLEPDASLAVLAPNAEYVMNTNVFSLHGGEDTKLTQAQIDDWKSGKKKMVIAGKLTYEDVFGCPHWTTFAVFVGKTLTFGNYREHNDADDTRCQ